MNIRRVTLCLIIFNIKALLTLNSCPMFTYNERDMHRMPAPAKTHLPIKPDIISSGIMEEDLAGKESEVCLTK